MYCVSNSPHKDRSARECVAAGRLKLRPLLLTCRLAPPPDEQGHLAVPRRSVHQVDDVSVRLPHHRDPVHQQQLVAGPQASVQVRWALLDDGADQDLSSQAFR